MGKGEKKNVILITIDALRADHLHCMGHPQRITPNLDRMAKKGVLFSQAFSNGPKTNFSFPSLFTSAHALTYPPKEFKHTGQMQNYVPSLVGGTTIAERLKREGYLTVGFHSNPYLASYFNYHRGFDHFFENWGLRRESELTSIREETRFPGGRIPSPKRKALLRCIDLLRELLPMEKLSSKLSEGIKVLENVLSPPYETAETITSKVRLWLKEHAREPFFLWLHYMDPHRPYELQSMVKLALYSLSFRLGPKKRSIIHNMYTQQIKYVDRWTATLLEILQEEGLRQENTYVLLTSDHGEEFWEHGGKGHPAKLYDELLHVPLVLAGPQLPEGKVIRRQIDLSRLPPLLYDLLGLKKDREKKKHELPFARASIRGKGVISEYALRSRKGFSYRTNNWKYILTLKEGEQHRELYNLRDDPSEKTNLVKPKEELAKKIHKKLREHMKAVHPAYLDEIRTSTS